MGYKKPVRLEDLMVIGKSTLITDMNIKHAMDTNTPIIFTMEASQDHIVDKLKRLWAN
jgi:hypothetical protein